MGNRTKGATTECQSKTLIILASSCKIPSAVSFDFSVLYIVLVLFLVHSFSNDRMRLGLRLESYLNHETGSPQVVISISDSVRNEQTPEKIWISYKKLFDTVTEGAVILLDDGAIEVWPST